MNVDYEVLEAHVEETMREVANGSKHPIRTPKVRLEVVKGLQGEVTAGKFVYRTDAAVDAGGYAEHPRPMDYLLGALASCQQMWCLRWAALNGKPLSGLAIEAESVFSWRGEYLGETDAGMTELHVSYHVEGHGLSESDVREMADIVARRCPVMATFRRAVPIKERLALNGRALSLRLWQPGVAQASDAGDPP